MPGLIEAPPAQRVLTPRKTLTPSGGNASEALNNIRPGLLVHNSLCWVDTQQGLYRYDALATDAESLPTVVAPAGWSGPGRWRLIPMGSSVTQTNISRLSLVTNPGPIPAAGLRWNGTFKAGNEYFCSVILGVMGPGVASDTSQSFFLVVNDNDLQPPVAIYYAVDLRASGGSALPQSVVLSGSFTASADFDHMLIRATDTVNQWILSEGNPYFNQMTVIEVPAP